MRNTRNIRSFDAVRAALTLAIGLTPGCGGRAASTGVAASGTSEGGALQPLEDGGGTEMLDDAGAMETGTTFAEAAPARQDSSDAGQPWPACPDASPVLVNGLATGFAQCSDGTLRRRSVVDCPYEQRPGQICPYDAGYRDAGPYPGPCNRDSDCTQHPYGQCLSFPMGVGCICAYGCVRDSDCNPGQICVCAGVAAGGGTVGQCSDSTCVAGSSTCPSGGDCAGYLEGCTWTLSCDEQSPRGSGLRCGVTGRPYLVRGETRTAQPSTRGDWSVPEIAPNLVGLSPDVRARLADHWTRVALMEHASVAAFARFALQLLAVAAPPELVEATHRAMADETNHARMAFALSSTYARQPVGPGPLAIEGTLDGSDLETFVSTLVREGCLGETVAAIEAGEALSEATDPAVQGVLSVIAGDELRHAELAWRTLRWLVDSGLCERNRVQRNLDSACAELERQVSRRSDGADELAGHGVLGAAHRRALVEGTLAHVVRPCARALLLSSANRDARVDALRLSGS